MNMFKRLAVFFLICFVSRAYAVASGAYVGGQVGSTNLHNSIIQNDSPSNTGFGFRFFMGGQYNQYFAVEGGYTYYAPSKYNSLTTSNGNSAQIQTQALDLAGKGIYPIWEGLGIYGKAGIAAARWSPSGVLNIGERAIKIRPTAAIGASYDLTQTWVGDISWSRIFKAGGSTIQNADLISLGLSYHFVNVYCGQFLC